MTLFLVRQYRPNFCTGFENAVVRSVERDKIIDPEAVPFCANFMYEGFNCFKVEDYGNGELIISAYYDDGRHWVVAFACEEGSLMSKDWRYKDGNLS